jgi:hypothetical protein
MLDLLCVATAAFLPQGPGTSTAPIVINEFVYDDSGTDDYEFVELYNRSASPIDISGWTVLNPDAGGPTYGGGTGADQAHLIAAGAVIPPGGFYVLGNVNIVPAPVIGLSQILPANGLENGAADAIELRDLTGTIIDRVVYESYGGAFGVMEGFGIYGDCAMGNGPASTISRKIDGWDTDDNGADFLCLTVPTPGASNLQAPALPYVDDFNIGVVGANVTGWQQGWVPPTYVDPTAVSAWNPHARPASPDGGFAMATWDNSGGGNSVGLVSAPVADVVVDTYVYIESLMVPFDPTPYSPALPTAILDTYNVADGEWWAVGVRGTAAANGNPPDVGGYFATVSQGVGTRPHFVTGLCWAHFRTPTFSQLWLLDMGNGADPANANNYNVIAGPIDIAAAGWYRIRLQVEGDQVQGNFGGTVGCNDGQIFRGTTTTTDPGGIYIAYREAILYNVNGNAGWHPPHYDAMSIYAPTNGVAITGTPSPTTAGSPTIGTNGPALIGSTGANTFAFTGGNMVPGTFSVALIGLTTIPAPGFPIPGAPATVQGYVVSSVNLFGLTDANGDVSFPVGIPCVPSFVGIPLSAQIANIDPGLPAALPIGTTSALTATIGF